jgi:ankyrin repeat protein
MTKYLLTTIIILTTTTFIARGMELPPPDKSKGDYKQLPENKNKLNEKLLKAARAGDQKEVEKLLSKGANINAQDRADATLFKDAPLLIGATPLIIAAYNFAFENMKDSRQKNKDLAIFLVNRGADFTKVTSKGENALMMAVQASSPESLSLVSLLVEKGIDIQAKNNEGKTAYDLAKANCLPSDYQLVDPTQDVVNFLLKQFAR